MDTNELRVELLSATAYKCYHCHGVLGVTTPNYLFFGAARFSRHITFDCTICEKTTFWKPENETLKKNKQKV